MFCSKITRDYSTSEYNGFNFAMARPQCHAIKPIAKEVAQGMVLSSVMHTPCR